MNLLLQDLRYATRVLLKQPGFTFLVALTFALGIGANSAIFSVVNAVLLRPLPYAQPEQLVAVYEKRPALGRERNSVSPPDFLDWKAQNNVFQHIAAYTSASLNRTDADEPERLIATTASADFFATLGVPAQLGRTFAPEEDQAGAQRVAVLSHRLWQRRFGSDPKVIGRALTLNGNSYVVIGVMPRSFEYPDATTELWVPLVLDGPDAANRGMHFLNVIARLKKDTTLSGARAEMETIASRLEQAYDVNRGHGVNLFPLHSEVVGQLRKPLLVLAAAVGCVLLIACVNVANLLLVRATARRKEIAIRTALGATKPRIVRQFMAESLLLCVLGGTAGLLLAVWGTDLLVALSPADTPRREQIAIDPATLGFSLIASLSAALVFGLLPAWQFCRPAINDALKEGGRGSSDEGGRRLRSGLVVTEIAPALVLLVGAGLLLKSFARLRDTDAGINPRGVLTAQVLLPRSKYKEPQAISAFARDALERMRTIPGVDLAGATVSLPLGEPPASRYFSIEGRAPTRPGEGANANFNLASPDYFRALSIPLRRGRDFTDRDVIGAPAVAIINEALARKYFPDEDALGKRIRIGDGEWHT
ncbi:MAG TPA: ABC transporter permease, partial [Chthoniobacterales bacterium]|nr:ABC transporter permease [Chthoniobacterales bacterium]